MAVLTVWDVETLTNELQRAAPLFFILTNTRAMSEAEARAVNIEICQNLRRAQIKTGVSFDLISRGDSTLRGHFPAELEAIEAGLEQPADAWFLIPFFEEGGRITRNDVHYLREGNKLIPVAQTPFAQDATFGYKNADLKAYIEEKTQGRIPAKKVISITQEDLQSSDSHQLKEKLVALQSRQMVIVNAEKWKDVWPLAQAIAQLPQKNFLFRTAASWVKVIWYMENHASLPETVAWQPPQMPNQTGGLIIVGSYVPKSTLQLRQLIEQNPDLVSIEIPVADILDAKDTLLLSTISQQINRVLAQNQHVVVFTSRDLVKDADPLRSLQMGNQVSDFLVKLVKNLQIEPRFLVAKGGITSSDVATKGLGMRRAIVRGQLIAGVPVWEAGSESRFPHLTYVVFPGNVGDDTGLSMAFQRLTQRTPPPLDE